MTKPIYLDQKLAHDRARLMDEFVRHLCGQPFSWDVFKQLSMECGFREDTLFFRGTPIYRVRLETERDRLGNPISMLVVGTMSIVEDELPKP